jgi:hypothetical protein
MKPLVSVAALAFAAAASPAAASELPWLTGYWLDCAGKSVSETWIDAGGATLVGLGLTQGRSGASFEFMRIAKGADGKLAFHAMPSGAPATAFPVKSQAEQSVTFENLQHDFPQRVSYRREGDVLHARIEGMMGGKLESMTWVYKTALVNAACPPRP